MQKKTVRMADGSRSDTFRPYREGYVDVTVSVPIEKFKSVYDSMVAEDHLHDFALDEYAEDDLRVLCAVFDTVSEKMPMHDCHKVNRLVATACCLNSVQEAFQQRWRIIG